MEARNGKDIQGIPWERLNFTRDKYRETRLKQYRNYENLSRSREDLDKVGFRLVKPLADFVVVISLQVLSFLPVACLACFHKRDAALYLEKLYS